jgi:hypothetical protein
MNAKQVRWLVWIWRVVGASYVAGVLTLSPYGSMIVVWAALLFTPLLIVTLVATRSKLITYAGIPVVLAALIATFQLFMSSQSTNAVPRSLAFMMLWSVATLGPVVLYILVTRHLSKQVQGLENPQRA